MPRYYVLQKKNIVFVEISIIDRGKRRKCCSTVYTVIDPSTTPKQILHTYFKSMSG